MSLQNWLGLAFALCACWSAVSIAVAYHLYIRKAEAGLDSMQKSIDEALEMAKAARVVPDEGSIQDILASTRKRPNSH